MAQSATNPKIEELRSKLKADPKSRLFYQLAEELRKALQYAEAEQVLRSGIAAYPTYLAAWVSLGRVLREQKKDDEAIEALNKALQLDPGNVVAARILADSHLALGNKIEAIKKYKLVHALHPADEELQGVIERLDRELSANAASHAAETPASAPAPAAPPPAPAAQPAPAPAFVPQAAPPPPPPAGSLSPPFTPMEESPFDRTIPPFEDSEAFGEDVGQATSDVEPMSRAHEESPFEEPVSGFTSASLEIESPLGMSIEAAPMAAEVPAPLESDLPVLDSEPVFTDSVETPVAESGDAASTLTMADLYARQGLVEDARHIYEKILAREPENAEVRAKLAGLAPRVNPKVAHLERWLAKVTRREVGDV
jgi:tetratricopeptide (TPR) repeat protein